MNSYLYVVCTEGQDKLRMITVRLPGQKNSPVTFAGVGINF